MKKINNWNKNIKYLEILKLTIGSIYKTLQKFVGISNLVIAKIKLHICIQKGCNYLNYIYIFLNNI